MLLTLLCKQSRETVGQYNTDVWCIVEWCWLYRNDLVQSWKIRQRSMLLSFCTKMIKDDQICQSLQGLFAGQLREHMTWFDTLRSGVKVKLRQPRKYAGRSRFWGKAISSVCSQSVPVSLLLFWLESTACLILWFEECLVSLVWCDSVEQKMHYHGLLLLCNSHWCSCSDRISWYRWVWGMFATGRYMGMSLAQSPRVRIWDWICTVMCGP